MIDEEAAAFLRCLGYRPVESCLTLVRRIETSNVSNVARKRAKLTRGSQPVRHTAV